MAAEASTELVKAVALLGAGVIAVPLVRRLGLSSVVGYLAAGLVIGPYGLALFADPQAILHFAELGVVMFLFVIGLEMQPARLWTLRRQIFGLGAIQVAVCGALLTLVGIAARLDPLVAFIAAMGFVLSSTAVIVQVLDERGEIATPHGQKMVSILLLEDLAIVPLLALVAFYAPATGTEAPWRSVGIAVAALAVLLAAGRWLLNPLFQVLAAARAREVLTAAALLVVLGAALLMQVGGLTMALGAFLAGVLLAESSFRHQLEADIEPFRGILLGLFFLSVGMALDLSVIAREWPIIVGGVLAFMVVKAIGIYTVARVFRATHYEGVFRAALFAQGGEFAFVLYSAAATAGIVTGGNNAAFTAIVILSMALTPFSILALKWLAPKREQSFDGVEKADHLQGSVLLIGFGRFGQVVSHSLLARGIEVSIIDIDTEMIRSAADFGFKVYYGDGNRLDVLHASGAGSAKAIIVCVDKRETATHIARLVQAEFPLAKLLVRSYDREHALVLVKLGVQVQVRETFDSAMAMGEVALAALGVPPEEIAEVAEDVRRRDAERFKLELVGGERAGVDLIRGNMPRMKQTPLTPPKRPAQPLSEETAEVTARVPATAPNPVPKPQGAESGGGAPTPQKEE
ncbi:MAG: monovalent cation:proton antiporter-2 (CPA2) family protein [Hyphomicrobiaceae bacterium]